MQENNLFEKFMKIEWLMRRYRFQNYRFHGPMGDPHRGQGRILAILKMQPEISQKDLAYLLDIRPQSLGELLAKLENSGYIERSQSEGDRRVMNIKLTEEGTKAAEKNTMSVDFFDCLSEEEQNLLSEYLDRIIGTMEPEFGNPDNMRLRLPDERPDFDMMPEMPFMGMHKHPNARPEHHDRPEPRE